MKLIFPSSRLVSLTSDTELHALVKETSRLKNQAGAVFLDRDGTINHDRGYLRHPSSVRLLPFAGKAIRLLNDANVPVIVVTNQTVVGRNEITNDELEIINRTIWDRLGRCGASYNALYYCAHDPVTSPGCFCRKPAPGLLLRAALDFKVDLTKSFMVGDKLTDIQAGKAAGCKTIFLGPDSTNDSQADFVSPHLLDSVLTILRYLKTQ